MVNATKVDKDAALGRAAIMTSAIIFHAMQESGMSDRIPG
jgi:hypothetical protein